MDYFLKSIYIRMEKPRKSENPKFSCQIVNLTITTRSFYRIFQNISVSLTVNLSNKLENKKLSSGSIQKSGSIDSTVLTFIKSKQTKKKHSPLNVLYLWSEHWGLLQNTPKAQLWVRHVQVKYIHIQTRHNIPSAFIVQLLTLDQI